MAIEINDGRLRALIDPEEGAGVMAFAVQRAGSWIDLMPDVAAGSDLACSSFLMVPYSNRIEHGAFSFAGRQYQLANGENHAIHGDVRKRPWKVLARQQGRLRCGFDSAEAGHCGADQ